MIESTFQYSPRCDLRQERRNDLQMRRALDYLHFRQVVDDRLFYESHADSPKTQVQLVHRCAEVHLLETSVNSPRDT